MSDYRYYVQVDAPGEEPCVYTHPDPDNSQVQVSVYSNHYYMITRFAEDLSREWSDVKYSVLRYKNGFLDAVVMEYLDGEPLFSHYAFE
jgi:hypothetical protein